MDWYVQVQTQDGQIKTVQVYDYNYASDAKRAALAQTGASKVIYASCTQPKPKEDTSTQWNNSYHYEPDYDWFPTTIEELIGLLGFIGLMILTLVLVSCPFLIFPLALLVVFLILAFKK